MNNLIFLTNILLYFNYGQADFRDVAVAVHNEVRGKHSAPPLSQSDETNSYAQNWVDTMASTDEFKHSPSGRPFGECIYATSDVTTTDDQVVTDAVNFWYTEGSWYNYSSPGFSSATGHFTQIVWVNCINVGIGVARSSTWKYVCASYNPPGNVNGQFAENVLPS